MIKLTFHFICVHSANILKVPTICQTVSGDGASEQKNNRARNTRTYGERVILKQNSDKVSPSKRNLFAEI